MITDDGREVHDIQQSEAGGGEDYSPFGTPETKEESLGFKDPAVMDAAIKRLQRKYYPPWYVRLERWARHQLSRISQ
jgi:hypothetical protein